ncbi:unnamed protein product [Choristocarpus tenellus]
MRVKLQSRETLVVWVAYCLVFATSQETFSVLRHYGVGLRWKDLRHLVLNNKVAVDAALAVSTYLREHQKKDRGVFTLHDEGRATINMAERYARSDSKMCDIWEDEKRAAQERKDAHWANVLRKQELVRKHRQKVTELKSEVLVIEKQLEDSKEVQEEMSGFDKPYRGRCYRNRVGHTCNCWRCKQVQLVIFFLYMPDMLRNLSRISFTAQMMLLPLQDRKVQAAVQTGKFRTQWVSYYNEKQQSEYNKPLFKPMKGSEGAVLLGSVESVPKHSTVKLSNVDKYCSSSDGIWHPDILAPGRMGWKGSGFIGDTLSAMTNPFSPVIPTACVVEYYTERLPDRSQSLQWAMPQYGWKDTSSKRGNMAISRQDEKPDWLEKQGYLSFGALRAFPRQQLRKLCVILHEKLLPLGESSVRLLLQQAMYHLGDLTDTGSPQLAWRLDAVEKTLPALCIELEKIAGELKEKPRDHKMFPILAEIAVYVAEWHTPAVSLAHETLASIPRAWTEIVAIQGDKEALGEMGEVAKASLRAKQCMFYMYSLLCYGGSVPLSDSDAQNMCELMVLANNRQLFTDDERISSEIDALMVQCHHIMVGRSAELVNVIRHNPSILTGAVSLVLEQTPYDLEWCEVKVDGEVRSVACFEAESSDGHLYSINIITGTLLMDGSPPSRLPEDVVTRKVYTRNFGNNNFEVAASTGGVLKTTHAIGGYFYEFSLDHNNDKLCIKEEDAKRGGSVLQLLEHDGDWCKDLPVRLRSMHSHWLSREHNTVVLRPIGYERHETDFIIRCHERAGPGMVDCDCVRIPTHLRSQNWIDLLNRLERGDVDDRDLAAKLIMVDKSNKVLSILSKFEPSATAGPNSLVHTYLQPNGGILFDLPRFGLLLELDFQQGVGGDIPSGGIRCLNYQGYRLAECQQLIKPSTLREFTRYLVLESVREGGGQIILVPQGEVVIDQQHHVTVSCSSDVDAVLDIYSYSVHKRWFKLTANCVSSRLQLAALYAATGTLLPEPLSQRTGSEIAMELIRQTFVNHPLPPGDVTVLEQIVGLGWHYPALVLLCNDLFRSSTQLEFLHDCDEGGVHEGKGGVDAFFSDCLAKAGTAYLYECSSVPYNARRRLTVEEEVRVLGVCSQLQTKTPGGGRIMPMYGTVEIEQFPIKKEVVTALEESLYTKAKRIMGVTGVKHGKKDPRQYPLHCLSEDSVLAQEMHSELQNSWNMHIETGLPLNLNKTHVSRLEKLIVNHAKNVGQMCGEAEEYLVKSLRDLGDLGLGTGNWHALSYGMSRLAGVVPTASVVDALPMMWHPRHFALFNPFLSEEAVKRLVEAGMIWLRLCVLDDKLKRLKQLVHEGMKNNALLREELEVTREFDPYLYPKWLVFEVDNGLQVRPRQAEVAQHMIHHPGDIIQLNMGEGKTRVILPLLVLHWVTTGVNTNPRLVRLNFLSSLIDEAYSYMHQHLCASIFGYKVFRMPFHRDVQLTVSHALAMRKCLERCQQEGGVLIVAPEHRFSLHLKAIELRHTAREISMEISKMENLPYTDIYP